MTARVALVLGLALLGGGAAFTQAPPAPGISRQEVVNNDRVVVSHLELAPGAREQVHTHPFDAVVVQLTAGTVEMTLDGKTTTASVKAGQVWFVRRDTPHAAANVGSAPYEVVTVALK